MLDLTQTCRTCKVEKPLSGFWRQPTMRNGRQSECKACLNDRTKRWKAQHKEITRERERLGLTRRRLAGPRLALLRGAKQRAAARGLPFDLTLDDIVVPDRCPILGIVLRAGYGKNPGQRDREHAPSIDRVDNSKGYVRGNIVVISYRANRIKSDATLAELRAIVEWYNRHERTRSAPEIGGLFAAIHREPVPHDLPSMFAHQEEASRSMPLSDGDSGRGAGELLALSVVGGDRVGERAR